MRGFFITPQKNIIYRILSAVIACVLSITLVLGPSASYAQTVLNLPAPGAMILSGPAFTPIQLKAIKIFPDNPLRFDFIVDSGDTGLEGGQLKEESIRLMKYFLASLTIPEEDMWVNLSPYEKDRIIPNSFGQTEMGRDLLAQDYILKQLTASLMYPEKELGKKFWGRMYKKVYESCPGCDLEEIAVDTFNKVWIVPEKAVVYQHQNTVFVVESRLKVMLESDYENMRYEMEDGRGKKEDEKQNMEHGTENVERSKSQVLSSKFDGDTAELSSQIIKEIILPEIEREVNEGKTFARLRQIYHALILATWFKTNFKDSILAEIYVDRNKISGVDVEDKSVKDKIYQQYLEAFKKGVYNYIKEDIDPVTKEVIPRKYFSGGTHLKVEPIITDLKVTSSPVGPKDYLKSMVNNLSLHVISLHMKYLRMKDSFEQSPVSPQVPFTSTDYTQTDFSHKTEIDRGLWEFKIFSEAFKDFQPSEYLVQSLLALAPDSERKRYLIKAEHIADKLKGSSGQRSQSILMIIKHWLEINEINEAKRLVSKINEIGNENLFAALLEIAKTEARIGQSQDAEATFNKVFAQIKKEKTSISYLPHLAKARLSVGLEADDVINEAIDRFGVELRYSPESFVNLAQAQIMSGQDAHTVFENARKDFVSYLEHEKSHGHFYWIDYYYHFRDLLKVAQAEIKAGYSPRKTLELYQFTYQKEKLLGKKFDSRVAITRAMWLAYNGKYNDAITFIKAKIVNNFDQLEAFKKIALFANHQGYDVEKILKEMESVAIEGNRNDFNNLIQLIELKFSLGKDYGSTLTKALNVIQREQFWDSHGGWAIFSLAKFQFLRGDINGAAFTLRHVPKDVLQHRMTELFIHIDKDQLSKENMLSKVSQVLEGKLILSQSDLIGLMRGVHNEFMSPYKNNIERRRVLLKLGNVLLNQSYEEDVLKQLEVLLRKFYGKFDRDLQNYNRLTERDDAEKLDQFETDLAVKNESFIESLDLLAQESLATDTAVQPYFLSWVASRGFYPYQLSSIKETVQANSSQDEADTFYYSAIDAPFIQDNRLRHEHYQQRWMVLNMYKQFHKLLNVLVGQHNKRSFLKSFMSLGEKIKDAHLKNFSSKESIEKYVRRGSMNDFNEASQLLRIIIDKQISPYSHVLEQRAVLLRLGELIVKEYGHDQRKEKEFIQQEIDKFDREREKYYKSRSGNKTRFEKADKLLEEKNIVLAGRLDMLIRNYVIEEELKHIFRAEFDINVDNLRKDVLSNDFINVILYSRDQNSYELKKMIQVYVERGIDAAWEYIGNLSGNERFRLEADFHAGPGVRKREVRAAEDIKAHNEKRILNNFDDIMTNLEEIKKDYSSDSVLQNDIDALINGFSSELDGNIKALKDFIKGEKGIMSRKLGLGGVNEKDLRLKDILEHLGYIDQFTSGKVVNHSDVLSIYVSQDPVEILNLGVGFDSCLNCLTGSYQTNAMAYLLDLNKRVVFIKNSRGSRVARISVALAKVNGETALVPISRLYVNTNLNVEDMVISYLKLYAEKLGIPLIIPSALFREIKGRETVDITLKGSFSYNFYNDLRLRIDWPVTVNDVTVIRPTGDIFKEEFQETNKSSSPVNTNEANLGGIDFNMNNLSVETKGGTIGGNLVIDPELLENLMSEPIDGFMPVIINIVPANMPLLLGLTDKGKTERDTARGVDLDPYDRKKIELGT